MLERHPELVSGSFKLANTNQIDIQHFTKICH